MERKMLPLVKFKLNGSVARESMKFASAIAYFFPSQIARFRLSILPFLEIDRPVAELSEKKYGK